MTRMEEEQRVDEEQPMEKEQPNCCQVAPEELAQLRAGTRHANTDAMSWCRCALNGCRRGKTVRESFVWRSKAPTGYR